MSAGGQEFQSWKSWTDAQYQESAVNCLAFSNSGEFLALGRSDSTILLFWTKRSTLTPVHLLCLLQGSQPTALLWTADNHIIASTSLGAVVMYKYEFDGYVSNRFTGSLTFANLSL
jgi:WD40 repeat protein